MFGNRRFLDRTRVDAPVHLTGTNLDGSRFTIDCALINYSDQGIGLKTQHSVAVASPVHINVGPDIYSGEVRYCSRSPLGYYIVGVRLAVGNIVH